MGSRGEREGDSLSRDGGDTKSSSMAWMKLSPEERSGEFQDDQSLSEPLEY